MSARIVAHFDRPLRAIRLHSVAAGASNARGEELLEIGARSEREAAARAARDRALADCLGAIEASLAGVPEMVGAQLDRIAGVATELGLALARAVVGDVVMQRQADMEQNVRRCLGAIDAEASGDALRVHVSAADLELVQEAIAAAPDLTAQIGSSVVVADAALGHGAVRVESDAGTSFYDPIEAIERICREVAESQVAESQAAESQADE